ncbi:hypothetical protein K432DRAFT_378762 [Lepidopterella palustris CBS 459.81]|uniref:Uncharacterized protein n=1 Tax=Lepidopterella palustris CBS 459.81 TaxID=1314670 RepID=A0A8E2JIZ8_9PEZI|nr:hypothetical protein K432DRAFT_378762 [Lepidopterella palustris CBS 459.81]
MPSRSPKPTSTSSSAKALTTTPTAKAALPSFQASTPPSPSPKRLLKRIYKLNPGNQIASKILEVEEKLDKNG